LIAHGMDELFGPAQFWMWVVGPLCFYLIERTIRLLRGSQKTIIIKAIQHPSRVLEIRMKKTTFNYKPGQYIFLCCPYIANYEWHPFTISSSPDEDFLSVHIRIVGDWTGKLSRLLNPDKSVGVVQENLINAPNGKPIFLIDGPFGAASEDVYKYKNVILFAAGIGVTPFASILKDIRYQLQTDENCQLARVHFYWTNRDRSAFEWFTELLATLEKNNINNFLDINIYLTGQMSVDQIKQVMYEDDDTVDQITGLEAKTQYMRPPIDQMFQQMATKYTGETVGVFFCGPPVISKTLYRCCRKYTKKGTRFVYHKENF